MKSIRLFVFSLVLLALLPASAGWARDMPPQEPPRPGLPHWATPPRGPDFAGVELIPFYPAPPNPAAVAETRRQSQRYLGTETITNVQVSHSGWISGASHSVNDFSEGMLAADPADPNHLLGCSKFFYTPEQYDFFTGVFESYDGGFTWTEMQPTGVESYSLTSDPVTTFDDQGNGYFTLLTRGPTGVDMQKKPAGGDWELPVPVDRTTSTDKQWIAADQDPQGKSPHAGYLYMSWTSFDGSASEIFFSRSTDGNQTWSPPFSVADNNVQGSIPGVAPDGTVYVVFGRNIFLGPTPGTIEFVKSTDGGATFSTPAVAANITAIPWYLPDPFNNWVNFRSPASLPGFAVSPTNGNLYIVWADYRNGDSDIYFARSTDGGDTWSTPVRLNDDPVGNGIDQWQPQVTVAPNGRVAVMWFDRRLPCPNLPWIPPDHVGVYNGCIDTFMTRSFDDGQTWVPNIRASVQSWDWTLNLPITSGGDGFIGDYQGIAANNEYDFPFWNSTANLGENDDNYQQMFVAMIPVARPPDLSLSSKEVSAAGIRPGEGLTYTLHLENRGTGGAPAAALTDTLPLSTTFAPGSLWFSDGSGGYDPASRTITWTGALTVGGEVTITFAVTTDLALPDGAEIVNSALITDGFGIGLWRTVTTTVLVPPTILGTFPVHQAVSVPLTSTVVVTFSEPMERASLVVTSLPDPGGWSETWGLSGTVVTLSHAPFTYSTAYTLTISAADLSGLGLEAGPVENPWTFSTVSEPEGPVYRLYLPLVSREVGG